MKPIEELNISPWPWYSRTNYYGTAVAAAYVCSMSGELLCGMAKGEFADNDQRLMKEAPNLYVCLREAVNEKCHFCKCQHGKAVSDVCHQEDGKCFVQKWRAALAEAAGEEVSK